jgi:hypothetical protein
MKRILMSDEMKGQIEILAGAQLNFSMEKRELFRIA